MSTHILHRSSTAVLAWAVLAALGGACQAANVRQVSSFDRDWKFSRADAPGADAAAFDDASWRTLNVPHDWSIEGPFEASAPTRGSGAFAPSGVVWYRKSFTLQASDSAKRAFIDFDGVMANSDVWINGFHLGKRPYGYVSFQYELTGHLNYDGKPNVISVRADTSQQPASRWYSGGGIYRHVRLELTDPVHIDNWGTFVTTPRVTADSATVHVRSTAVNQAAEPREISLQVTLLGPDGKPAGTGQTAPQTVAPGKSVDFDQDVTVNRPDIWDIDHPVLYSAVAALRSGNTSIDDQTVPFGIRQFEFKAESGFWLNGKNFKLKGVCLHHDAGGLGAAVPEDEWIHRLQSLKQLGANAIRCAHNPPSPEFHDACDKVGMLVMDEMFDCWTVAKNPFDYHLYFNEWHLADTRDTVRRDRNHPSIILYSAGNEIHDTPKAELALSILGPLVQTFHENDPTRPVTQALFRPNSDGNGGAYKNGLSDLLDVVGTNYRDAELLAAHAAKPSIKIIGTEQGRALNVWAFVRDNPQYSGDFIWTGVDYLGESRGPFPLIGAGAGVVDITDQPKVEGLQRASWWSDKPVVYIARMAPGGGGGRGAIPGAGRGRGPVDDNPDAPMPMNPGASIDPRDGMTYVAAPAAPAQGANPAAPGGRGRGAGRGAGRGGAGQGGGGAGFGGPVATADWTPANLGPHDESVQVYSNCDEVELFLNGKSLGSQPRGEVDSVRRWTVPFEAGTLRAVGRNKGVEAASNQLITAGKPAKVKLVASTTRLFADFDSVAHVTAYVTDDKGVTVPTAADTLKFTVSGPGSIEALENAQLVAQDFRGKERAAYHGSCVAFIRADAPAGKITLTVSGAGLQDASVSFDAAEARPGH